MSDAGVTVALGTEGAASKSDLDLFGEMRDAAMLGKLATEDATALVFFSRITVGWAVGVRGLASTPIDISRFTVTCDLVP